MRLLIPTYRYPTNPLDPVMQGWIDQAAASNGAIVMNPNSGPGEERSLAWQSVRDVAKQEGVLVFGYVTTARFQAMPLSMLVAIAERYVAWYKVDGIFWDEVPTIGSSRNAVSLLLRWTLGGRLNQRRQFCVMNTGTGIDPRWHNEVPAAHESQMIWMTHEDFEGAPVAPVAGVPARSQAGIIHTAADAGEAEVALMRAGFGWGFATTDTLPNPYDGEP